MTPVMGDGNGEGDANGCSCFQREEGGGEAARWCRTRMTQRRVARRLRSLKVAASV
jgi:hypothetical protein